MESYLRPRTPRARTGGSEVIPCKHLDYTEGRYTDCEIRTCEPHYPLVRYWHRGEKWTDNGPKCTANLAKVQFCGAGRGRIDGIFQCYNGEMHCYEPDYPIRRGATMKRQSQSNPEPQPL